VDKRILVLDDNEDILDVVTEALTYEGYTVRSICRGNALFETINNFRPQLILLDFRLADASGIDLCRQLKSMTEHRHIKVIIFSAYLRPGQTFLADCDAFLSKPFDLEDLSQAVRNLLPADRELSS
jgi:CheY-like chemotaxis protein